MITIPHERATRLLQQPASSVCPSCSSLVYADDARCFQCNKTMPSMGWSSIGAEDVDPLIGQILNQQYLVTGLIGKGASSKVYRVLSRSLPRAYAAKILTADVFKEGYKHEWVIRTQREVDTMMRTNNPHIVSLHNVFALSGSSVCLIMDLVEGQTLEEYLPESGLDVRTALNITEQIALAIQSIHQLGVIHRDIKPENIMISNLADHEPFVTLLDFGLVSGDQRITKDFIGTPTFASPEICSGGLDVDQRSDLYSIGTVLFYLLTGQVPFPGKALFAVIHQKVTQPAPSLNDAMPTASSELVAFVDGLLSREKSNRPENIKAMLDQLAEIRHSLSSSKLARSSRLNNWLRHAQCLIASESEEHAQLIQSCFQYPSQCRTVYSADQLLAACAQHDYDLLFISLQLPRLRDLKAFVTLRKTQRPFVVIVPEHARDSALDMLEVLGVPYLLEPLNKELVSARVSKFLD